LNDLKFKIEGMQDFWDREEMRKTVEMPKINFVGVYSTQLVMKFLSHHYIMHGTKTRISNIEYTTPSH
jgi:hypothetical protein